METEPVDGFTVTDHSEQVEIVLSNRYGKGEVYLFPREDALKLARAVLKATGQD